MLTRAPPPLGPTRSWRWRGPHMATYQGRLGAPERKRWLPMPAAAGGNMPHASPPAVPPSPQAVAIVPARTVARARRIARDSQRYGWSYQTRVESPLTALRRDLVVERRPAPTAGSLDSTSEAREALQAVGTTRPVRLTDPEKLRASGCHLLLDERGGPLLRRASGVGRRPAGRAPRQPRRRRGSAGVSPVPCRLPVVLHAGGRLSPTCSAAQVAPTAELLDFAAGDREALSGGLRFAADNASVDRLRMVRCDGRSMLDACRWLSELVGHAFCDARRCEWAGVDDRNQPESAPERENRGHCPRYQNAPAGPIRDWQRRLRDEQRRLVHRLGLVEAFRHALPQLLCQILHAHSVLAPGPARQDTIGSSPRQPDAPQGASADAPRPKN